jgi:competence protein ComEC
MTALVALHPFSPNLPAGVLEVTALDCGQGDSLFIVLPDKTTLLLDASGTRHRSTSEGAFQGRLWDPGEDIVSPYLWSRGIKKIDIVALSQQHEDHLGGLFAVARNFSIGEFWRGAGFASPVCAALLESLREKRVPERTLAAGEEMDRGGATIRVLWPPRSWSPPSATTNDGSLVLRLAYQGEAVLLTGDISSKVERELMTRGEVLNSQVLKVAHHGSRTSSSEEFLARVNPRLALLTGGSSEFGNLPSAETLERLSAQGATVYRPDVDGASSVRLSSGDPAVSCYREHRAWNIEPHSFQVR